MNLSDIGVILIDGPSGSGKTQYIRKIGATSANTLTSEQLTEVLLQMARDNTSLADTAAGLHRIQYIENLESLCGKAETQTLAAQLIQFLARDRRIILTGIGFQQKLPFLLAELDTYQHLVYPEDFL